MALEAQVSAGGQVSGDSDKGATVTNRSLAIEVTATTVAVLVLTHVLYATRSHAFIGPKISYIVAYILMGTPMLVLWLRKRSIDFFSLSRRDVLRSLVVFGVAALVLFPPFLVGAHFWQRIVGGHAAFSAAGFPRFINIMLVQLVLVALPEEFFFRGYFQSAMNRIFVGRWNFLGARIGWGLLITAAVFAVAHTIVTFQWWHFSIFFPALVFGWLRERTGNIIAPTLFHAASNLLMDWFTRCYT